jgi:cytidine deaminase
MIADGGKQIIELVIVGSNNEFCFPCGGCRQKLAEFSTPNTLIKLVTQDNQVHVTKVAELLPNAFNLTTDG